MTSLTCLRMLSSAVLLVLLAVAAYVHSAPNWDTAEDFSLRGAPKSAGTEDDENGEWAIIEYCIKMVL